MRGALVVLVLLALSGSAPGPAAARDGSGESRIDELSPDAPEPSAQSSADPRDLPGWAREFVAGSFSKYEAAKGEVPTFRRQGWYPSLFVNDPARDVLVEAGPGAGKTVTVHVYVAQRDLELGAVVAPARGFLLTTSDRAFLGALLLDLSRASPEIALVRMRFWFAGLTADGRLVWESRGAVGLTTQTARALGAGQQAREELWGRLDENTVPAALWGE